MSKLLVKTYILHSTWSVQIRHIENHRLSEKVQHLCAPYISYLQSKLTILVSITNLVVHVGGCQQSNDRVCKSKYANGLSKIDPSIGPKSTNENVCPYIDEGPDQSQRPVKVCARTLCTQGHNGHAPSEWSTAPLGSLGSLGSRYATS